jgi:HEAT repeat protein
MAAKLLNEEFLFLDDKERAWQDLIALTYDYSSDVKWMASNSLRFAFSYVTDVHRAWQDLIYLLKEEDYYVTNGVISAIEQGFPRIPDKQQAWQDLIKLAQEKNSYAPWNTSGIFACGVIIRYVPDKFQAWQDLISLTQYEDWHVRHGAAEALSRTIQYVFHKQQAWRDLITLTKNEDSDVRMHSYHSLGCASIFMAIEAKDIIIMKSELNAAVTYYIGSAEGHEYPDLQVGDEVNPRPFFMPL